MSRFKTTKADGSVHFHEMQWVSHVKHEHGDHIEDTWEILPEVFIDKLTPPGSVYLFEPSDPEDRMTP